MSIASQVLLLSAYSVGEFNKDFFNKYPTPTENFLFGSVLGGAVFTGLQLARSLADIMINSYKNDLLKEKLKAKYHLSDTKTNCDRDFNKLNSNEQKFCNAYEQQKSDYHSPIPFYGIENIVENVVLPGVAFVGGVATSKMITNNCYAILAYTGSMTVMLYKYENISQLLQDGCHLALSTGQNLVERGLEVVGSVSSFLGEKIIDGYDYITA